MSDYEFDIGDNAESLGWGYLILRFVLPWVGGLFVIIFVGIFLAWFLRFAVANTIPFQVPVLLQGFIHA